MSRYTRRVTNLYPFRFQTFHGSRPKPTTRGTHTTRSSGGAGPPRARVTLRRKVRPRVSSRLVARAPRGAGTFFLSRASRRAVVVEGTTRRARARPAPRIPIDRRSIGVDDDDRVFARADDDGTDVNDDDPWMRKKTRVVVCLGRRARACVASRAGGRWMMWAGSAPPIAIDDG